MSRRFAAFVTATLVLAPGRGHSQEARKPRAGKAIEEFRCNACHRSDGRGAGPALEGLFGKSVRLQAGEAVTVDEAYVRESILIPSAKVAAGFQPIMPSYEGLVTEEQLLELVEYVKSLKAPSETARR